MFSNFGSEILIKLEFPEITPKIKLYIAVIGTFLGGT